LNSYQAVLQLNFDGTSNGAEYKVSQLYDVGFDRVAGIYTLRESGQDADGKANGLYAAAIAGLVYLQDSNDESCDAAVLADPSAPVFEPAGMLPAFRGGLELGTETLQGAEVKVYTFDSLALNAGNGATATGKVWVSDPAGWVLKYELTLQAGPEIFGEGVQGTQTWVYSLSNVNTASLELAPACPAALSGLPVPEDATDVLSLPGLFSFTTAQTVEMVAAFYTEQLVSLGWTLQGDLPDAGGTPRWLFSRLEGESELVLLVLAEPQESSLLVRLIQIETAAPAQ
jgi:hypothetical protein